MKNNKVKQIEYFNVSVSEALREIIDNNNYRKILVVTGKNSYAISGAESKCKDIFEKIEILFFSNFSVNPNIDDVSKLVELVKVVSPDVVIAIGGGTAIDISKAALALANVSPQDFLPCIFGEMEPGSKPCPLVAVPTTSGTGAEATHFAVVYVDKIKHSLAHQSLLPDVVILDPTLTMSLSAYQTAVTGMDALSQAIEAMWSINASEESILYSKDALEKILTWLPVATKTPTLESRERMLVAANRSGKAINIARTTAAHAMSYPLTANKNIPHGHAVSLTLPAVYNYNSHLSQEDATHPLGVEHTLKIFESLNTYLESATSKEAAKKLSDFIVGLGLKNHLSDFGISNDDIEKFVNEMSLERASNNPRVFTRDEARKILNSLI